MTSQFSARLAAMAARYPDTRDRDDYLDSLDRNSRAYYMVGHLESAMVAIAEAHVGCRRRLCGECRTLSIALSMIVVYHELSVPTDA